jgi:hypothetical protein
MQKLPGKFFIKRFLSVADENRDAVFAEQRLTFWLGLLPRVL